MANISNRSPWQVKLAGQKEQRFRLKSKALEYLASQGHTDPSKLPKNAFKQLETAFEVQIKLADKDGNVVIRMRSDDSSLPAMDMLIPAMKVIQGDSSSTSNVNEINVSDCVDFTASNVTIKSFQ